MRCDDVEVRLDCMRSGELADTECEAMEAHLANCPECRQTLELIEAMASSARRLMGECKPCCLEAIEESLFDRYDHFETGRGELHVAFSSAGVRRLHLGGTKEAFATAHQARFGRELHCSRIDDALKEAIAAAIEGRDGAPVPVDLSALTEFEKRVLETLLAIPRGEVRTYAWVAREAGKPAASRAVGNACARNPIPFVVPCHRVVPTAGGVGSYAFGPSFKRDLLGREGVSIDLLDDLAGRGIRYVGSLEDHSYCFPTCRAVPSIPRGSVAYFRSDDEAVRRGFEPCDWCRPLARSA